MAAAKDESATVDSLSRDLVDRIRRGYYAPGQRLVESEIMQDFGAGRSKVRETLKTLVGEGYLTFEKNRGAYVRRFTRQEAIDRARLREMIEGLTARQAAEKKLSADVKKEFRQLLKAMDKAAKEMNFGYYSGLNEQFHDFILRQSGNDYAADLLKRLSVPVFRLQFQSLFTSEGFMSRHEDHKRIGKAVLEADPELAEKAMREHLSKGIQVMSRLDDDLFA